LFSSRQNIEVHYYFADERVRPSKIEQTYYLLHRTYRTKEVEEEIEAEVEVERGEKTRDHSILYIDKKIKNHELVVQQDLVRVWYQQ